MDALAAPTAERRAGERVAGRYELARSLGAGAFGEVWSARDLHLDRPVALKFASAERMPRTESEGQILARLKAHPNVVQVLDVLQDGGEPILVMEYVEGQSLRQRLDAGPAILPVGEAVQISLAVLVALDHVHRGGVLHRDVKPANVLLGADGAVKLGDFGLGKLTRDEISLLRSRSGSGSEGERSLAGTLAYMAPEQGLGHEDARSDLYSVGVLLYETLTGRRPEGHFLTPSEARPEVVPELSRAVMRALRQEPSDRWPSAREMAETLRWFAAPEQVDEEQVRHLRRVLHLKPEDPATNRRLGLLLCATEPAAAEECLRRALHAEPQDEQARAGLATCLAAQGRHEEAIALRKALAAETASAEAVDELLRALTIAGCAAAAEGDLQAAESLHRELEDLDAPEHMLERVREAIAAWEAEELARREAHVAELAASAETLISAEQLARAEQALDALRDAGAPPDVAGRLRAALDAAVRAAGAAEALATAERAIAHGKPEEALEAVTRAEGLGADLAAVSAVRQAIEAWEAEELTRREAHVAELVASAEALVAAGQLAQAEQALDALRDAGAPPDVAARLRAALDAAVRAASAADALARAEQALAAGQSVEAWEAVSRAEGLGADPAEVAAVRKAIEEWGAREWARREAHVAELVASAEALIASGRLEQADRAIEGLKAAGAPSDEVARLRAMLDDARASAIVTKAREAVQRRHWRQARQQVAELRRVCGRQEVANALEAEVASAETAAAAETDAAIAAGDLARAETLLGSLEAAGASPMVVTKARAALQAARAPARVEVRPAQLPAGSSWPSGARLNERDGSILMPVPPGERTFGSSWWDSEGDCGDERPRFRAYLPGYYIGVTEVTNAQYAVFLSATRPSSEDVANWILLDDDCFVRAVAGAYEAYGGKDAHPVVQVSWYGAQAYCQWAGLRLPSELEWEMAARGTDGRVYPWVGYWDNSRCRNHNGRRTETTAAVGSYPSGAGPYGLLDMAGNVWEWCLDWYDASAYARYRAQGYAPPRAGRDRVLRGGSWRDGAHSCRSSDRAALGPSSRCDHVGFRVARDL